MNEYLLSLVNGLITPSVLELNLIIMDAET